MKHRGTIVLFQSPEPDLPTIGDFSGINRDAEPSHGDDDRMDDTRDEGCDDQGEPLSPFLINPEDWKKFMRAVGVDRYSPY